MLWTPTEPWKKRLGPWLFFRVFLPGMILPSCVGIPTKQPGFNWKWEGFFLGSTVTRTLGFLFFRIVVFSCYVRPAAETLSATHHISRPKRPFQTCLVLIRMCSVQKRRWASWWKWTILNYFEDDRNQTSHLRMNTNIHVLNIYYTNIMMLRHDMIQQNLRLDPNPHVSTRLFFLFSANVFVQNYVVLIVQRCSKSVWKRFKNATHKFASYRIWQVFFGCHKRNQTMTMQNLGQNSVFFLLPKTPRLVGCENTLLLTPAKFNIAPEKWWLEDYFPCRMRAVKLPGSKWFQHVSGCYSRQSVMVCE